MDRETARAINNVSKRLNIVEKKMEAFLLERHEENKETIAVTNGGVTDLENAVCEQSENTEARLTDVEVALCDLSEQINGSE